MSLGVICYLVVGFIFMAYLSLCYYARPRRAP